MAFTLIDQDVRRTGENQWRGVEIWEGPANEAEAKVADLWNSKLTAPGVGGGNYQPDAVRVRLLRSPSNTRLIEVYYKTLPWDEWLERFPGHGVLITNGSIAGRILTTDENGLIVSGLDAVDQTGRTLWKEEGGLYTIPEARAVLRVFAMTRNRGILINNLNNVGKVTSTSMSHFYPFSKKGEAMCIGIRSRPRAGDPDIEAVTYDFL